MLVADADGFEHDVTAEMSVRVGVGVAGTVAMTRGGPIDVHVGAIIGTLHTVASDGAAAVTTASMT